MIVGYEDYPFTALHRRIIDEARRFGLDTLDLLDAFSRDDVASLRHTSTDPVHLSRAGHRLAAETIYAYLHDERLLERRAP
jgi:lysophospholipase L1-like esterase